MPQELDYWINYNFYLHRFLPSLLYELDVGVYSEEYLIT